MMFYILYKGSREYYLPFYLQLVIGFQSEMIFRFLMR